MAVAEYTMVSDGTAPAHDGTAVAAGTGIGRLLYDPANTYPTPPGVTLVLETTFLAGGGTYYVAPVVIQVPPTVERWQLQALLAEMPSKIGGPSTILADANAMVAGQPQAVQIAWANAPTIDRASPTLAALAPALGLQPSDIDNAFIAAAQISL